MGKVENMNQSMTKEQGLQEISENLNELKRALANVLDRYEEQDADEKKLDVLTEALDALEDAYDAIDEVLLEER